jgi:NADH dehydrogenase
MSSESVIGRHRVVIVGGGFGGLYAAQNVGRLALELTLVDRRNFHLFQPLLYQVATGGLSPGDIASPLRAILKHQRNTTVIQAEVVDFDTVGRRVILADGALPYDTLVVAAGMCPHHFGHDEWASLAPDLKQIEDALEMRHRILRAFERAERESELKAQQDWLRFVVVGGGPTGVELAGAVAELAHHTLKNEFRAIDPRRAEVILLEGGGRILPSYPAKLSDKAVKALENLGVEVKTGARVEAIEAGKVAFSQADRRHEINTHTILWGAGMRAVPLAELLAKKTAAATDRSGRIAVEPDLSIAGHPEIFVIGDLALVEDGADQALTGGGAGGYAAGPLCGQGASVTAQGASTAAFPLSRQRQSGGDRPLCRRRRSGLCAFCRVAGLANLAFYSYCLSDRIRQ